MKLTKQQKKILRAVADTFIPSTSGNSELQPYWNRKGSDINYFNKIEEIISALPIEQQKEFRQLLDLLSSQLLGITWFGALKSIDKLNIEQREQLLQKWASHPLAIIRKGYISLKKLIPLLYFGYTESDKPNPNWEAIQYDGPIKQVIPTFQTKGLKPLHIDKSLSLSCEVLVIGSGAGGGVVAAELAKAGKEVLIVEKGDYIKDEDMNFEEVDMLGKICERKAAMTSMNGSTTILAGSCVGGGTTVNWSASFRTPDYILHEWATEHGNAHFLDSEYKDCFEFIEKRTNINTTSSIHNPQNQFLLDGAKKLGYETANIPRNVQTLKTDVDKDLYWKSQGYACLGDKFGYKQGTMKTFLQDAVDHGARILANTQVQSIRYEAGIVQGAKAIYKSKDGNIYAVTIKAKKVVVSAGAIHTPAILMRSGLRHSHIGKHLYLHPVNAVVGDYDKAVKGWEGPIMSATCDEFTRLDGNFGYKIETPPLHSGFMALALSWNSGQQFKKDMLRAKHLAAFLVLTRDKFGGRITLGKEKRALAHYTLNAYDKKHLLHGIKESVKIHEAAGAKRINVLHNEQLEWRRDEESIDVFLKRVERKSWSINRFILFSAHQMGTCRMGGANKKHPVLPTGESREVKNLYVADASVFPQCSGVNPMLSIQALAYYISKNIF